MLSHSQKSKRWLQRTLLAMAAALPLGGVALADDECPELFTVAEMEQRLEVAEGFLRDFDTAGALTVTSTIVDSLPCLEEVVSGSVAARFHRLYGVLHWVEDDYSGAQAFFTAARSVRPDTGIDTSLYPEGHQIHDTFSQSVPSTIRRSIETASGHAWYFDGARSTSRPSDYPTIAQYVEMPDDVLNSGLMQVGDELPGFEPLPTTTVVTREQPVGLVVGTAMMAGVTTALGLLNQRAYSNWTSAQHANLPSDKTVTNVLATGTILGLAGTTALSVALVMEL